MAELVVLVRHAKAQDRSEAIDDPKRELTEAGKRSCHAAMGRLPGLMAIGPKPGKGSDKVSIWTSEALRARQTAEIAADVLGVDSRRIAVKDALTTGSADALLSELAATSGIVVAVGHNPFLEELAKRACGVKLHLGKSAAIGLVPRRKHPDPPSSLRPDPMPVSGLDPSAALPPDKPKDSVDDGSDAIDSTAPCASTDAKDSAEPSYELAWFLQGPHASRWETLVSLESACSEAGDAISSNAWKLLDRPDDPEALHQYRISIRVGRSLLGFLEPYLRRREWKRATELLKRLQAPTSRLRELDVMFDELSERDARLAYADADKLLSVCAPLREKTRRRFVGDLADSKTQADLHGAVRLLRAVEWRDSVEAHGLSRLDLRERYFDLERSYEKDLAACDFEDAEATHAIRKRSKQQRYVAREFADVLGDDCSEAGAQAKSTQELLGKLCDSRVGLAFANQLLEPHGKKKKAVPDEDSALSDRGGVAEGSGASASESAAAKSPVSGDTRESAERLSEGLPTYAQAQILRIDEILAELRAHG
jgi:phosphohistidine phosphatase SixA/CHAD domain-containing protein